MPVRGDQPQVPRAVSHTFGIKKTNKQKSQVQVGVCVQKRPDSPSLSAADTDLAESNPGAGAAET